jgi:hypothetical protein
MKTPCAILIPLLFAACADDGGNLNAQEVITTVILEFQPDGGGTPVIAEFDDPDGNGGDPPTIDPIDLTAGVYTLTVRFENRLEDPAEDITQEVEDESADHLLLFTGSAVVGPATDNASGPLAHEYADTDENGLPIGLANSISAGPGGGELTVTLRHMPAELPPVKAEDTVDLVREGGVAAIGGSTDAQVTFDVTVVAPAR